MKSKTIRQTLQFLSALAVAGFTCSVPTASASVIYWDPNAPGGFGSIATEPFSWVPSLNIVWTASNNGGTSRLKTYTTSLTDDCNWGGPSSALGGGTVPVGNVSASSLSFNTITGSVILSGGTITLADTTNVNASISTGSHTISSTLAGAAISLTKLGPGTINLSGNNTYTGSTIVSAGTLNIGSNALSNSTLDTTNSIAGTSSAGLQTAATALTLGGLSGSQDFAALFTTTSGGYGAVAALTLNPGVGVTDTYPAVIADGAAGMSLTKSGSGTQVLGGANTFSGATTLNGGTLTLDYSSQDNSKLADGAALILSGGTLNLSGGTHTEVVGSTTLTGAVNVTRSSGTAKIALGAISGTGTINFSDSNIATTTNANNSQGILGSYATVGGTNFAANDGNGNIVAYSGYLNINARGPSTIADNASSNVSITGDGTSGNIELGATTTTINTLSQSNVNFAAVVNTAGKTLVTNNVSIITGAQSLSIGAAAGNGILQAAASGGTLVLNNVNPAQVLTINAAIPNNTSASGLTKVGAGSVVLAGANTFTGTTLVGSGTLSLSGSLSGSPISVSGDGALSQSSTGSIAGAVGVTLASSGTSTLAGSNTYSGVTSINNGLLNIQSATALGTTDGGTIVTGGAALQIQGNISVGAEALTLNGTGIATTGALRSISGTNTWGGLITLGSSTRIQCDADSLTMSVASGDAITGPYSLIFGGDGNITVANPISTGAGTLTKEGSGTLTLLAANTFTTGVAVTAGVLNIQNSTATGSATGGVNVGSAAALQMQGNIALGNQALYLQGTGIANTGALRNISGNNTWRGLISLAAITRINSDAGTLTINVPSGNAIGGTGVAVANPPVIFGGSGNITVSNTISIGTGSLTKDGTGTLTLSASDVYSGATTLGAGTLNAKTTASLGDGSATNNLIFAGGTLQAGGTITSPSTRAVTLTSTALIDTNGNAVSIAGILSGAGGLTVSGTGTLTLSGANTYTGATAVSAGKLFINGSQAAASGDVSVSANATLGGSGAIGGNTTIADGGKLEFNISTAPGSYSKLVLATGKTLALSGATVLSIDTNGGATTGLYTLVTAPGASSITGAVPATVNLPVGWIADPPQIVADGPDTSLQINITSTGPKIAVEYPVLTDIANNGSVSFGAVSPGSNASPMFTIRNTGTYDLSLTGTPLVSVNGTNASDFTVTAMPTTPVTSGGGTTTFTVQFAPGALGARSASLAIADTTSNESLFVINVSGTGQTQTLFEAWASGTAFEADANGDGVNNGLAFLLGAASPGVNANGLLPVVTERGGNLVLTFSCLNAASRGNAVLSVEHSSDIGISVPWVAAAVPEVSGGPVNGVSFVITPGNPLNGVEATIEAGGAARGKLFGRLKAEP